MSKSTMSRRALVAGIATAAVPTAVLAASISNDPIFAAIERHRQIENAFRAAARGADSPEQDDLASELCGESSAVLADLVAVTPTTVVGCVAVLRYLDAYIDHCGGDDGLFENCVSVSEAARNFLSRIAATLEKAVQS